MNTRYISLALVLRRSAVAEFSARLEENPIFKDFRTLRCKQYEHPEAVMFIWTEGHLYGAIEDDLWGLLHDHIPEDSYSFSTIISYNDNNSVDFDHDGMYWDNPFEIGTSAVFNFKDPKTGNTVTEFA